MAARGEDTETKELWDNLDKFKDKLKYNKNLIEEIEKEQANFSKDLAELNRINIDFLFKILKQGFDCRSKGIEWIIHLLWKYGQKVLYINLPDFLDKKAKIFLIERAKFNQRILES